MLQLSNFTIETAVANQSGAMEADTISKNGRSLKSQMSRGNIMQRTFLPLVIFCISMANMFAQDVITLKNGDDIQALVQEIGNVDVKYKKFDNPNGPSYTLKKSEIVMIQYENGSKDVFANNTVPVVNENTDTPMPMLTDQDFKGITVGYLLTGKSSTGGLTTKAGKQGREKLRDFEKKMYDRGFTRRIVVFDFFSEHYKDTYKYNELHVYSIGIWINQKEQLIALHLNRDSWNEVIIPFHKFQKAEILEDGFVRTSGVGVSGDFVGVGTAKSKEKSTGIQVRVVEGDVSSGIKSHILKLYDPLPGGRIDKSEPFYKSILECAKSIEDEIDLIIQNR